jgi:hypothetical protein
MTEIKTTKFHPILFSTPMVKAIQEGRKTQTRRVIKDKLLQESTEEDNLEFLLLTIPNRYNVGDVLWVRETFVQQGLDSNHFVYKANHPLKELSFRPLGGWKPSIFMPKIACRIFLKLKSVRVEKLQNISEEDAKQEGADFLYYKNGSMIRENFKDWDSFYKKRASFKDGFHYIWEDINMNDSWNFNPFVWAYEFEQIEKPLDFIV